MADESVYRFIFEDEGGAPPPTSPGAAARASAAPIAPTPPREAAGAAPAGRSTRRTAEPETFGQAILEAIRQASQYSSLAAFTAAGASFARPLADLGRLADRLRGGPDSAARPGRASTSPGPIPVAQPVAPGPQTFTISQAVFNAQGAKILITGGDVVVSGRGPGSAAAGRGGGFPPVSPRGPAAADSGAGLPALRTPTLPAKVPDIDLTRTGAAAGAAGRAAVPAVTAGATGGAAASAAGGVAALGASAAAAVAPIAAVVVAAGAAALALRALYRRSTEQAKALAAYDATLAAAQARAQVSGIRQDIRSAQFLGRDLAKLTEAQNRIGIATTRILDAVEKPFLEQIVPLLQGIATVMETVGDVVNSDVAKAAGEIIGKAPLLGVIGEALKLIGRQSENRARDRHLERGDFYGLFMSLDDLELNDDEGQLGAPGGKRPQINAPGFGPLPMP